MTNGSAPQVLLVLIWVGEIRIHEEIRGLTITTEQPLKSRTPMDLSPSKLA